jgi:uncharacterized protein (DUF1778 family)
MILWHTLIKTKLEATMIMTKKHITFRIEPEQLSLIERIIAASKGKIETLSHFIRLAISEKTDRETPKRDRRNMK